MCLISKGGDTLTLRQTDPRVKTTGRKSHDPFKLTESRGLGGNTEEDTERERGSRGMNGWDLFFSLLFFSAGLTQVSADMLGACPGVDYNIKTTTGKTRGRVRQKRSERKATD